MPGILYPAFQKMYSAFRNFNEFDKESNFFDNISSLDAFFSEYRNITFVIKKSFAHTPSYLEIYEKYRKLYLKDNWFVEKRNEITKEAPFKLVKQINITQYFPNKGINQFSSKFTVENDISIDSLLDSIKKELCKYNSTEVFFSAKFNFYEENGQMNVIERCILGINDMKNFLFSLYEEVNDHCSLCDDLKKKIEDLTLSFSVVEYKLINDYVYYPETNKFERSERISCSFGNFDNKRASLRGMNNITKKFGNDYFKKFVLMNLMIQSTNLMPTLMTVYNDDTFTLEMFNSDVKTTFYRKINEKADQILNENIKEVYLMMVYVVTSIDNNFNTTFKERLLNSKEEILVFMKIDSNLQEEEYSFDGNEISDIRYIIGRMEMKDKLRYGKQNMTPIKEAFKNKIK